MATGKSFINITLLNGTADGALKCANRAHDGIIYKIKRDDISNYTSVPELKQCGIYFLFGKIKNKPVVYIGQANTRKNGNGVLGRVIEHRKEKEKYWNEAFILISSKNAIGATELNYLENQLCNRTINAGAFETVNAADPNTGNYSDEVEITMDSLIEYTATVLKVLGYDLFGKIDVEDVENQDNDVNEYEGWLKLYIRKEGNDAGRDCQVTCVTKDGEYLILKGSKLATVVAKSCENGIKTKREEYKKSIDSKGIVLEDIPFSSPSTLAKFATLSSVNGKVELKDADGKTLKEILGE